MDYIRGTSHKENAKQLFTHEVIGQHWNDLYTEQKSCLDHHFIQRLELAAEVFKRHSSVTDKVLDLGCGAGVLAEKMVEAGYTVDAADMSLDMLNFTRERLAKFPSESYNVFQAESEYLDIPDNTYDVITCIGVFGYMDDVDASIKELRRILKPGGTLIMSIRNFHNLRAFDVYNWVRMIFVKFPRKVLGVFAGSSTTVSPAYKASVKSKATQGNPVANVISICDRPDNVIKIFDGFGFKIADFYGTGYGPFTFRSKEFLPTLLSKWLSNSIRFIARLTGLENRSKWIADISLYVFKRES